MLFRSSGRAAIAGCYAFAPTLVCVALLNRANTGSLGAASWSMQGRAGSEPFTLVLYPDLQYYTDLRHGLFRLYWNESDDVQGRENLTHIYDLMVRWAAGQRRAMDIRAAIFMGDMTQADAGEEWDAVLRGLHLLESAGIPLCVTQGDHDLGYEAKPDLPPFFFSKAVTRHSNGFGDGGALSGLLRRQPHLVEVFDGAGAAGDWGVASAHYHVPIDGGGVHLHVLCLEFHPRDAALRWASAVLRGLGRAPAIIVTHSYLDSDGGLTNETGPGLDGSNAVDGNDGRAVFSKLVEQHPNVFLVLCGHYTGELVVETVITRPAGDAGPRSELLQHQRQYTVHALLTDYQQWYLGGNSWLRFLRVQPIYGSSSSNNGIRSDLHALNVTLESYNVRLGVFNDSSHFMFQHTLDVP